MATKSSYIMLTKMIVVKAVSTIIPCKFSCGYGKNKSIKYAPLNGFLFIHQLICI